MLKLIDNEGGSKANPDVVRIIEDMLIAAKEGRVQGIAGIAISNAGNAQVYLNPGDPALCLSILGGLEMVKMSVVENYLEIPVAE